MITATQADTAPGNAIIVGCQRSGTSALWRALITHSAFKPSQNELSMPSGCEKELWYIQDFMKGRGLGQQKCYGSEADEEYLRGYFEFVDRFLSLRHGGSRGWLYSYPSDGLYVSELLRWLPGTRIIFIVRHPQEVVWSAMHAPWEVSMSRSRFLARARQAAIHWKRFAVAYEKGACGPHRDRLLLVHNEEMRGKPASTVEVILNFLDLPAEEQVLQTLARGAFHSSFLAEDAPLQEIDAAASRIPDDVEFCQVVRHEVGPYMEYFGYRCYSTSSLTPARAREERRDSGDGVELMEGRLPPSGANEKYWREQLRWYEREIARRKHEGQSYNCQEIYLYEYFQRLSAGAGLTADNTRGPKVLEFGFGFGRHLRYLSELPGIQFYGCDQSPQSTAIARGYFTDDWATERLAVVPPRGRLPYEDGQFEVVFTVSVLIHVAPEDLAPLLQELLRICRGHILHIENAPVESTALSSVMHQGCWVHPLVERYNRLGWSAEVLESFSRRHGVYRVRAEGGQTCPEVPAFICRKLEEIERNDEAKREQVISLERAVSIYQGMEHTRAFKIQRWLSSRPALGNSAARLFDFATGLRDVLKSGGTTHQQDDGRVFELSIGDPGSRIVSVCNPLWQGVRSAAEEQSANRLYLKACGPRDIPGIVDALENVEMDALVFNGFWRGYDKLMIAARKALPRLRLFYVHHGSFYQMKEDRTMPDVVARMIHLHKRGVLNRVGFVKNGMAEAFRRLGVDACAVMNTVSNEGRAEVKSWRAPVKVAIPVRDLLRKNPDTQIVAALMLEDVDEVHVWHRPNLAYLEESGADLKRVIVHEHLGRDQTRRLLAEMTAVFYVSISECYPMVILESFASGTPCFTGSTHGVLTSLPDLERRLVICNSDNPVAIAEHVARQRESYEQLSQDVIAAFDRLNEQGRESWRRFLDA